MIHHFYHIYADGQWLQPVSEHVRALKEYGLYENLTSLHIGFVGTRENQLAAHQYIQSQGLVYTIADEQKSGWEQATMIPMHDFSKHHEGFILYAHSKGASDPSAVNIRWRRSMTWHNVCKWKYAINKLQDHGAYGCHWIQPLLSMPEHRQGNFMMAGTFFWTSCDLMRTWMEPPLGHRHNAEGWIGYGYAENPWLVWDCTPYFPNSDTFMDGWIDNPNYKPEERGKSIPATKTVNSFV